MKALDYYLQKRRFAAASKYIGPGSKLLDIGCRNGDFFIYLKQKNIFGTGLDPHIEKPPGDMPQGIECIQSEFPCHELNGRKFDVISALAVFEHIPQDEQPGFLKACYGHLSTGGKLILTVPSPLVDIVLHVLRFLKLIDTMEFHQHYGFHPKKTIPLARQAGFKLHLHRRFELGLNHIFVFEK